MSARRGRISRCGALALAGVVVGCSKEWSGSKKEHAAKARESFVLATSAGSDPGPRGGPAAAGSFFSALNATEQARFARGLEEFEEVTSVSGTLQGEPGKGLGPTFNGNSCAMCHAQPAVGGSSPGRRSPQNPVPNPQVALATLSGATNTVPPFITASGPVRVARFVSASSEGDIGGTVHGLYTIKGRTDAPGCHLSQPDFAGHLAKNNLAFRIPPSLFGLGLVENTPDATLEVNLVANRAAKAELGIFGRLNRSGNDGTAMKFGWKAQNKSLTLFAAEAYNVELGISNETFPNERGAIPGCVFNKTPEDKTSETGEPSDVVATAIFIRLSAPPTPASLSPSAERGSALFDNIGCVLCHSRSLRTTSSPFTGMANVTYHPFSDFALHHMGSTLADGVHQGATTEEFRTAPLWGIGQRLFFLHDGRTSDLGAAIEAHAAPGGPCTARNDERVGARDLSVRSSAPTERCASEANAVVGNYNALSPTQQTDLLTFLRTL